MARKKLDKLLKLQEELQEQIKAAKSVERKQTRAEYAEKCRIVGAAILAESEENNAFAASINSIIDSRTTKAKDRRALGLEVAENQDDSDDTPAEKMKPASGVNAAPLRVAE